MIGLNYSDRDKGWSGTRENVKDDPMELVLFDKDGDEIEWFDPVSEAEIVGDALVFTNGFSDYKVPTSTFSTYKIRRRNP